MLTKSDDYYFVSSFHMGKYFGLAMYASKRQIYLPSIFCDFESGGCGNITYRRDRVFFNPRGDDILEKLSPAPIHLATFNTLQSKLTPYLDTTRSDKIVPGAIVNQLHIEFHGPDPGWYSFGRNAVINSEIADILSANGGEFISFQPVEIMKRTRKSTSKYFELFVNVSIPLCQTPIDKVIRECHKCGFQEVEYPSPITVKLSREPDVNIFRLTVPFDGRVVIHKKIAEAILPLLPGDECLQPLSSLLGEFETLDPRRYFMQPYPSRRVSE